GVGDGRVEREQLGGDVGTVGQRADALEQFDRAAGPHAPVAEQASAYAQRHGATVARHGEGLQQIGDNVVVVARVESEAFFGVGVDDAPHDVDRAVPVEGRLLDTDHLWDRGELGPELAAQV